jgi:hypothetical protein
MKTSNLTYNLCDFIQSMDYFKTEEWCLLGCYAVWLLQEPHGVTTQKTPFFIVTAVKTSNLTLKQFTNASLSPANSFAEQESFSGRRITVLYTNILGIAQDESLFFLIPLGGVRQTTWYVGHYLAFCTNPGWIMMSEEQTVVWQNKQK